MTNQRASLLKMTLYCSDSQPGFCNPHRRTTGNTVLLLKGSVDKRGQWEQHFLDCAATKEEKGFPTYLEDRSSPQTRLPGTIATYFGFVTNAAGPRSFTSFYYQRGGGTGVPLPFAERSGWYNVICSGGLYQNYVELLSSSLCASPGQMMLRDLCRFIVVYLLFHLGFSTGNATFRGHPWKGGPPILQDVFLVEGRDCDWRVWDEGMEWEIVGIVQTCHSASPSSKECYNLLTRL